MPNPANPLTPAEATREVERANALLRAWSAAGVPVHGAFSQFGTATSPSTMASVGLDWEVCGHQSGGTLDFGDELGPTDGEAAVRRLAQLLVSEGCSHAQPMCGPLPE